MPQSSFGRTALIIPIFLALCLALVGLFWNPAVAAQTTSAARVSILPGASTLTTQAFSPDVVTVVIGVNNTVVWKNNDNVTHTATGLNFTGFNTGDMKAGASGSYTFNTAGTYPYNCIYHPKMMGTIIVKGSAVAAASGGGGIPEFPFQAIAVAIFTVLIVVSYLAIKRQGQRFHQRNHSDSSADDIPRRRNRYPTQLPAPTSRKPHVQQFTFALTRSS